MNAGKKPDAPDVRMGLSGGKIYKTWESSADMVQWVLDQL
jgi:hypothetical protein